MRHVDTVRWQTGDQWHVRLSVQGNVEQAARHQLLVS
jgi:hypothetical protein